MDIFGDNRHNISVGWVGILATHLATSHLVCGLKGRKEISLKW